MQEGRANEWQKSWDKGHILHCGQQGQILAPQMSCEGTKGQSKETSSLDYSPLNPTSSSFTAHFHSHFTFLPFNFPPSQRRSLGSGQAHQVLMESEEAVPHEPAHGADPVLLMKHSLLKKTIHQSVLFHHMDGECKTDIEANCCFYCSESTITARNSTSLFVNVLAFG